MPILDPLSLVQVNPRPHTEAVIPFHDEGLGNVVGTGLRKGKYLLVWSSGRLWGQGTEEVGPWLEPQKRTPRPWGGGPSKGRAQLLGRPTDPPPHHHSGKLKVLPMIWLSRPYYTCGPGVTVKKDHTYLQVRIKVSLS